MSQEIQNVSEMSRKCLNSETLILYSFSTLIFFFETFETFKE